MFVALTVFGSGLYDSPEYNGCLPSLGMSPWGYKAFVPVEKWLRPSPVITKFVPGHDYRVLSSADIDAQETVPIEIHFSDEMDCSELLGSISFKSTTVDDSVPSIDNSSVVCQTINDTAYDFPPEKMYSGQIATAWKFSANLVNVSDGVHMMTVNNAKTKSDNATTKVKMILLLSESRSADG